MKADDHNFCNIALLTVPSHTQAQNWGNLGKQPFFPALSILLGENDSAWSYIFKKSVGNLKYNLIFTVCIWSTQHLY